MKFEIVISEDSLIADIRAVVTEQIKGVVHELTTAEMKKAMRQTGELNLKA